MDTKYERYLSQKNNDMNEETYYSCPDIQHHLLFSVNGELTVCCKTLDRDVFIGNLKDLPDDLTGLKEMVFNKKEEMIEDFKNDKIYDCCKKCPHLERKPYKKDNFKKILYVSLAHFLKCNLRCKFCVLTKEDLFTKMKDTDHKLVLKALNKLHSDNILSKDFFVGIGGGEPSLSLDLVEIIQYVVDLGNNVHINTNAARFSQLFADGIKKGKIKILIAADAGSKVSVRRNRSDRESLGASWRGRAGVQTLLLFISRLWFYPIGR